jgi:hypothetical protein
MLHHAQCQTAQAREFMPNMLPQSPEASSFSKYGNYQVNLFTGLPEISIPLYEIKVGELTVPISINYHASGIKVNDQGSWVGTGWSLSAGGSVSRKIMGLPDDQQGNYLSGLKPVRDASTLDLKTDADLYYVRNVLQGTIDAEPDIFSYNFPGKSGQFIFNQANSYKPIMIPYDPITIAFNGAFNIKNESGTTFQFYDGEYSQFYDVGKTIQGMSSWVLTKMISANNQDVINFSYSTRSGQVSADIRDFIVLNDFVFNNPSGYSYDLGNGFTDNLSSNTDERKIQQITFPNGKVVFDASAADRLDGFTGQKNLIDIKVYALDSKSSTYTLIKTINFYESYFVNSLNSSIKRLRLDSLGIADNNGVIVEKYKFNYNTSVELPDKMSRARDYWGYYNGKNNNTLVPQNTQVPYQSTTASISNFITIGSTIANGRDPDPAYNQAYMLQTINFPTGGHTDFEYESNQYLDGASTVKYAGGLRVKSIKSYDGINPTPIVKTYKYGANEVGYGRANFNLASSFFQTTQNNQFFTPQLPAGGCDIKTATKRVRTFVASPSLELEAYDGSPVAYANVTEYIGDPVTNIGKTIYTFNDHPDGVSTSIAIGKPIITTYYENRGQLIDKQVYKNLGNNTYQIVAETKNSYSAYPEQFYYNLGLVVTKTLVSDNTQFSDIALPAYNVMGACNYTDTYNYQYMNYTIRTDDNKLTQTSNYAYDQNDPNKAVVTTTNYYYDNILNLQPTRIVTTNSAGDVIQVNKKYPHDYSTSAPYNTMVGLNIIDKVVQEQKLKNSTQQLTLQNNNYLDKGNGNYLIDNIQYQVANNAIETRANFNSYDVRGNILEMQKTGDIKMSLIWDYQKIYPVAQVSNAAQNQVAFTSFEGDGSGNWIISALSPNSEGFTGNNSYVLNSANNISFLSALVGSSYIISYWSKNGPVTLAGATTLSSKTGLTKNGWTYYEYTVSATSTSIILTASSAIVLDELRLYPTGAQMTTFTYVPLVGLSSQCGPDNMVTNYVYDSFNRLRFVKDMEGNIIKTMEYNYKK